MGYRRAEATTETPRSQKATPSVDLFGMPKTVSVFGEARLMKEGDIVKYLDGETFYYIDVYENNKRFGFPFGTCGLCPIM